MECNVNFSCIFKTERKSMLAGVDSLCTKSSRCLEYNWVKRSGLSPVSVGVDFYTCHWFYSAVDVSLRYSEEMQRSDLEPEDPPFGQ